MIQLSEIFYSVQGEGTLVGTPSVFVRTSGCNLRCHWCDTPYTSWKPQFEEQHLGPILATVRKHWGVEHVVVTGGEPMIQEDIVELTDGLRELGLHITIETSGTKFAPVQCDLMSISPKLSNSTPRERDGGRWAAQHDRLRLQKPVLKKLIKKYDYQLKFVVTAPEDLDEIRPLVEDLRAEKKRVVLMPEGIDPQTLHERSLWLVEICKNENYRFSPRLHIDLYGNKRGV